MKTAFIIGSNSSNSIHRALAQKLVQEGSVKAAFIELHEVQLPLYSVDLEQHFPSVVHDFHTKLKQFDHLVFFSPEHNGNMTVLLKNALDWLSRIEKGSLTHAVCSVISTSPGKGGAAKSMEACAKHLGYLGTEVKVKISIPQYPHFEINEVSSKLNF